MPTRNTDGCNCRWQGGYTDRVRRIASFVAVAVMLVMMMPTLACATTPKMSQMYMDCCRQMHGKCGEMAKQGCCQIEVHSDPHQLPSHVVTNVVVPVAVVAVLYNLLTAQPVLEGHRWQVPNEHSPPGLLVASTTVLRI